MTRAKRLAWMSATQKAPFTWSKPDNLQEQAPCPVFPALKAQTEIGLSGGIQLPKPGHT